MKVLVLGGTGFMGPLAVRALVSAGHEVVCFHRGRTVADLPPAVREVHGERAALAEHLAQLGPVDVALEMRAMVEAEARAIARALAEHGVQRAVLASSCDVYRSYGAMLRLPEDQSPPANDQPADETGPLRQSRYPYRSGLGDDPAPDDWRRDYDKLLVEAAYAAALPTTVVRLPMVYGPGDPQRRLKSPLEDMLANPPTIRLGETLAAWRACRGYVDDMAQALALAVASDLPPATYSVAEPEHLSQREWLEQLALLVGWPGQLEVVPDEDDLDPGFDPAHHLLVSSDKIRADLGYREALPPEERLRRAVAWELEQSQPE